MSAPKNPIKREEWIRKLSEPMRGNKNPAKRSEVREKISQSKEGKKRSEETKRKISEGHKGQVPWNKGIKGKDTELWGAWKGGISCEPYYDVWLDKDFKQLIRDRDGNRCLNPDCWKTSTRLGIHHINYVKKDCHPLNLITICQSCNSRANKDRDWHQSWYQAIIYNRYIKEI